jgi:hypothetical protein
MQYQPTQNPVGGGFNEKQQIVLKEIFSMFNMTEHEMNEIIVFMSYTARYWVSDYKNQGFEQLIYKLKNEIKCREDLYAWVELGHALHVDEAFETDSEASTDTEWEWLFDSLSESSEIESEWSSEHDW